MKEIHFNYIYSNLDKLLKKYIEMNQLIEDYGEDNITDSEFIIEIGESFNTLKVICKKQ